MKAVKILCHYISPFLNDVKFLENISWDIWLPHVCFLYVTRSRAMSHLSKIFKFEFSGNLKMLHFYANPVRIGCLVTELWAIYQGWKQYKTKEFELFPSWYFKNPICDIDSFALIMSHYALLGYIQMTPNITTLGYLENQSHQSGQIWYQNNCKRLLTGNNSILVKGVKGFQPFFDIAPHTSRY